MNKINNSYKYLLDKIKLYYYVILRKISYNFNVNSANTQAVFTRYLQGAHMYESMPESLGELYSQC